VTDLPLVTCIMPTSDRRSFVPRALELFRRQDYPNLELVVVDQGGTPVRDLMPEDPRVRYLRRSGRLPLADLRNTACEAARGEIIVHWDDDDWMASWRVRRQVQGLRESGADICGVDRVFFVRLEDRSAWRYEYPRGGRPYVVDSTMCYRRSFWLDQPFAPDARNPELAFEWNSAATRLHVLDDDDFYVGTIHAGNTAAKDPRGSLWRRCPPALVDQILAADGMDGTALWLPG